ncbi:MAG: tetratricopeptide repeat protein, partial [Desulfobulbaceae bacterium]|nr:tetratricopeptide repeat protein [Desulfobulbaceae bacterium]
QDLSWSWLKNKVLWISGAVLLLGLLAFFYTKGHPIQRIFQSCGGRDFTTWERVLTQFRVIIHYMGLIFYPNPNRLTLDYDFPLSKSLLDPITTLISLGSLIGLAVLAIFLARREKLLSFCIIWFLINLVIESSVICLELIFEHRTYLPTMFFILFFTAIFFRLVKNKILISLILISIITLFGFWTFERNRVWQDPVTFWLDSVQKSPGKARPHNNLGKQYGEAGRFQEAIHAFQTAIKNEPDYAEAHYNLGVIYLKQERYPEAMQQFSTDIQFRPTHAQAFSNIGVIYSRQGKIQEATAAYNKALNLSPNSPEALANLGILYAKQGDLDEAISLLRKAVKLKPDSAELHYNLGNMYMNQGRYDEAVREVQTALTLKPDYDKAKKLLNTLQRR